MYLILSHSCHTKLSIDILFKPNPSLFFALSLSVPTLPLFDLSPHPFGVHGYPLNSTACNE